MARSAQRPRSLKGLGVNGAPRHEQILLGMSKQVGMLVNYTRVPTGALVHDSISLWLIKNVNVPVEKVQRCGGGTN